MEKIKPELKIFSYLGETYPVLHQENINGYCPQTLEILFRVTSPAFYKNLKLDSLTSGMNKALSNSKNVSVGSSSRPINTVNTNN